MKILLLFLLSIAIACGTQKQNSVLTSATPLPPSTPVEVLGAGQKVPDGAKLLGHTKIGDSGMSTKCTYATVVTQAQNEARGMGGNLIQITKHKEPDLASTCHRLECDVYLIK